MRRIFIATAVFAVIAFGIIGGNVRIFERGDEKESAPPLDQGESRSIEIVGIIRRGETLSDIFKRYGIGLRELFQLREASASIHRLRNLLPGHQYKITLGDDNLINAFHYWIDDDSVLNIVRTDSGFYAERQSVEYEKRILHICGTVQNNLVDSMEEGTANLMLALQLSDIFAWDIDFTTDLRNNDSFKIVVEGLYLNGEFKKYGDILSAEFVNNGQGYTAYRFERNGNADYYDADGKALRKAFLKAPLSFRRISSRFSRARFHPVLKRYRPHHGVDYAAAKGTPVSAVGDGKVLFAGYKGQYGKLIIVKHQNGWKTYYGHLSRFSTPMKKGVDVQQGQIIGYVGATGLATGPHLHYEMRLHNKPVNPFSVRVPQQKGVPSEFMAEFIQIRNSRDAQLAAITPQVFARSEKNQHTEL